MAPRELVRPQAPSLPSPPRRQAAPIPGSTYVRPAVQQDAGRNAADIADALSSLNQSLSHFGNAAMVQREEQEKIKATKLSGLSYAEMQERVAQGRFPEDDAAQALYGHTGANHFTRQLTEALATEFNPDEDDIESFVHAKAQEFAAGLGSDIAAASFFKVVAPHLEKAKNGQLEYEIGRYREKNANGVVDQYANIVEAASLAGDDAQATADAIMAANRENKDAFPNLDLNAALFQTAQEAALAGNPELVAAILDHDRGGVGALGRTSEYRLKGLKLLEAAEGQRLKQISEEHFTVFQEWQERALQGDATLEKDILAYREEHGPGVFTERSLQGLITRANTNHQRLLEETQKDREAQAWRENATRVRNEQLASNYKSTVDPNVEADFIRDVEVPNPHPTDRNPTVTYTAEEQKRDTVNTFLAGLGKAVESGQITEEERFTVEHAYFSNNIKNNLVHPRWKEKLSSIHPGMTQRVLTGEEAPAKLVETAELYRQLSESPKLISLHASEEVQDFMDDYVLAFDETGDSHKALMIASQVDKDTREAGAVRTISTDDLIDEIEGASWVNDGDWSWLFGIGKQRASHMTDQLLGRIRQLTNHYLARGVNRSKAVEMAAKRFGRSNVVINGVPIQSNGNDFPPDFVELAKDKIRQYAETHPDEGIDPDTAIIQPIGSGQSTGAWMIWGEGMVPVENMKGAIFTTQDLIQLREDNKAESAQKWAEEQNERLRQNREWVEEQKKNMPEYPRWLRD